MGFFKFFKKKEEALDIPPPPPPISKTEAPLTPKENLPQPMPDISPPPQKEEFKPEDKAVMPELPPMPVKEEFKPEEKAVMPELPPAPEFSVPQPKSSFEPIEQESEVIHPFKEPEPQKPPEIKEKPKIIEKKVKEKVIEERHFLDEPLFVKTNQYRNILDGINIIKNKINECNFVVENLNEIKNKGDKEFSKWRSNLEDMQRKVSLVEKSFFRVVK